MPNLRNPYVIAAISLGLIVVGIWLGRLIVNFPIIELDRSIDFAEILNLILAVATLGIALYIASILDRKKKKEEYAFEFYSKKIQEIQSEVKQFLNILSEDELPFHIVNSRIKSISLSYLDLKEIMSFLEMEISEEDNQDILDIIHHIKRLGTEEPSYKFKTKTIEYVDEIELEISDGKLTFLPSRIDKVRVYTKKLVNKMFYLVMK